MSASVAKRIIVDGDVTELIQVAEAAGESLARQLTTSQIRAFFGEIRRIEANWPIYNSAYSENEIEKSRDAYRQAVLLRPKLAYQASRGRNRGVEQLREILDPCIQELQQASTPETQRLYFSRFVDFFEAILAYHKAAGGN